MDLLVTDQESIDAGAQLDSILASGRTPDPTDSRELAAHLERARRRALEKHPPPKATTDVAVQANDGVAPPFWKEALGMTLLLAVTLEFGILLGAWAVMLQWPPLTSLAGWWPL